MANPFDNVVKGYNKAQDAKAQAPKPCPTCGHIDDVPEPNKDAAEAFQKGATSGELPAGTLWANLKSGLGIEK